MTHKINVILAVDKNYGIGYNDKLPWNIPEELKLFKEKTQNSILIVGRKTFQKLPSLKDRIVFCVSRKKIVRSENKDCIIIYECMEEAIEQAMKLHKTIFIIGGNQIYNYIFEKYKEQIIVHISFINNSYTCDTYFNPKNLENFCILNKVDYGVFNHYEMIYEKDGEYQYIDLIKDLLKNGEIRNTRNGKTISDFCKHLKFDLRKGYPLLTTKKMFLKGIIEELLFFIRGDTNSKNLEEKGINIWKGNTNREFLDANGFNDRKEGEMGPMYGSQWRNFNSLYNNKRGCYKDYVWNSQYEDLPELNVDQLKFVINEIKTNPTSRRILMTSFNPSQVQQGVLWPCHSVTVQFYVQDEYLDMFCYNRSSDVFLGLPFNIASSSLFLLIIAKLTNKIPRYFNLSLGDFHIYNEHIDAVNEQIKRMPYSFPKIQLPDFNSLEEVEKITYNDFNLLNYNSYSQIKVKMIA
jgi:thymidylate synthase